MDNYSKVLTFFMENGVQLNPEQLEALKEEFLQEKSNFDKYVDSKANKAEKLNKKVNDTVFIPVMTKHRIQNDTETDMEFIEIQLGDNLDENDIVRYEDIYGRV